MGRTYRIGKAAKMLDLNTSVLRYWESEFPQLEPIRTRKGQRLYSEDHITLLKHIQCLLHDEGLTIEGARKRLEQELEDQKPEQLSLLDGSGETPDTLDGLKEAIVCELKELRKLLK